MLAVHLRSLLTVSILLSVLSVVTAGGCSQDQEAVRAPKVDPSVAAGKAISSYDQDGDKALSDGELAKCPGILNHLAMYDKNGDKKVEEDEIVARLTDLFKHGTGATQIICVVKYKGRPLADAEVLFEPEPYLGGDVQIAKGTTNGSGSVDLGIAPEFLPKHLARIKAVHYGTYKVRITKPSAPLPAKYNTETTLGYETEVGNPYANFDLK
jgi:hypothetical protein